MNAAPEPQPAGRTDFAALFHAAPAGYLLTLSDGTIVEANRTLCDWTGKSRAELVGSSLLRLMPAGDRIMYLTHAMPELDATGVLTELSVQIIGANGTRLPVLLAAARSRTAANAPELDRIVLFSAPERRLYERELAAAMRKLEAAEADRARLLAEARYAAMHDSLTGLPNRALFDDRLGMALAAAVHDGGEVGLLFCDVNGFKTVNDSMGHAAGDQVLCQVAARLAGAIRGVDTAARYSGDEFVVLVAGPATVDDVERVALRVLDSLAPPVMVDGAELQVGLAIGVAISNGDTETAEELLRRADADMYASKTRSRHGQPTLLSRRVS
ncbi:MULTISPECIES: sensor domain-containing diguanylate cyclase [Micrococcaceae]|uniref:sensor domain-containing diguanylate cyclase n=1 Tax=Micrococcaceae TaxID=1268 RepID=UPI001CFFD63E|nr:MULTISPECIES: sensor domain-containing diguanylate cyclase [Micrococcaceae]MCB5281421.1 putative signaling protein [Arthrobacter sp. ES1]MDJ0353194.1 sensor domain-containing diguanylate cyclase [Pseudarthrobacter sp. PH31-O2]WGZ80090.1 sensor domain-containing diguanylate cyclase [Arthrobacter sp. EM1]